MPEKIKVAVLASGRGSDFQSILDAAERGEITAAIVALITDNPEAKAIDRAKLNSIPYSVIPVADYSTREAHDQAVWKKLDEFKPDLVVLAGYMRIVRDHGFLKAYGGKMINIHPSLLPSFPGAHAQRDAFDFGAKISGYTIHFVTDSLDAGPVIYQEAVDISGCSTADEAAASILEREHVGLPKIIQMFAEGSFAAEGRKVTYTRKTPKRSGMRM